MNGAITAENRVTAASTGLAAVGAAGVGGVVVGRPGIVAGGVLVVAWLLAPPIFVVALGQLLFAAILPADAPLATITLVEAPLVAIVLVDAVDRQAPLRTLALGVASLLAFCGVVVAGVHWLAAPWHAAALLVCVAAACSYALHRYTVVTFDTTNEF